MFIMLMIIFFMYIHILNIESFPIWKRGSLSFFPRSHQFLPLIIHERSSSSSSSSSSTISTEKDNFFLSPPQNEEELKQKAYELLNCLACPYSSEDPDYNPIHDRRREKLLNTIDYTELKFELIQRGLPKNGEKVEMLTRLLLHIIDPSIDYTARMFTGQTLQYLTPKDILAKNITVRNEFERIKALQLDLGPDSDDLKVFRRIPRKKPFAVLDGLDRRETKISPLRIFRSIKLAHEQDVATKNSTSTSTMTKKINAYLVASNDIIQQSKTGGIKINLFLTNEKGWRSKAMRIIADEIALKSNSLVIVPDLFRGKTDKLSIEDEYPKGISVAEKRRIFDDIVATFQFARKELQPKAISLFGLGIGGGLAMEFACDVYAISCEGKKEEIDQLLVTDKKKSEAKRGKSAFQSLSWNITELIYNDVVANYLHQTMWLRKPLKERPPKFTIKNARQRQNNTKKDDPDDEEDFDNDEELEEIENLEEETEMMIAQAPLPTTEENEESIDADLRKQIKDFADEIKKSNQTVSEEPLLSSSAAPLPFSSPKSITAVDLATKRTKQVETIAEALQEKNYTEYYQHLSNELNHILERNNFSKENKLFQINSKIHPEELIKYVPNSVIVWNPEQFDREKIGKQLYSSLFYAEGIPDSEMNEMAVADRRKLCYELWKRRDEILDFMFRIYEETNNTFLHSPRDKHELKCRQEAILIGSSFAEMFNIKDPSEFIYDIGSNKYSLEVFSEVSREDLLLSPVYQASLNTHLHDEKCKLDYELKNEQLFDKAGGVV